MGDGGRERRERVKKERVYLTLVWTGAGNRQDRIMKTDGLHTREGGEGEGRGLNGKKKVRSRIRAASSEVVKKGS